MKIFINAGHGGTDPGAVSKKGTKEKDITKNIGAMLVFELIKNGFDVEFYQQKKSVNEVSKVENASKSDLFISLHCNAATSTSANGVEVLYYPTSAKGKECALAVQNGLIKATKLKDRGIKPRSDLSVLKRTLACAILIELAFISNLEEEKMLIENPEIFVEGIIKGIKNI